MKSSGKTRMLIVLMAVTICCLPQTAFSQEKNNKKIKSLTVIEERHTDNTVTTLKESETKYDERGNIIEIIEYKDGKVDTHFKYEYDSENNKIREIEYDKKGAVDKISEYKYKDGLRVEKCVYDAQKNLKLKKTYQYILY